VMNLRRAPAWAGKDLYLGENAILQID
jgi:hypothetical protein